MTSKSVKSVAKELPDDMNRGGRRVVRVLLNGLMHLIFRMEYIDKGKLLDKGPLLLISNHVSMFDVPALHVNFKPWIYFVAKEELFRNGLAGRFFALVGCNSDKSREN